MSKRQAMVSPRKEGHRQVYDVYLDEGNGVWRLRASPFAEYDAARSVADELANASPPEDEC